MWAQFRNQRNVWSFSFKQKHDFNDFWGGRHAKASKYQDAIQGRFLGRKNPCWELTVIYRNWTAFWTPCSSFQVTNSLWWQEIPIPSTILFSTLLIQITRIRLEDFHIFFHVSYVSWEYINKESGGRSDSKCNYTLLFIILPQDSWELYISLLL